MADDGTGGLVAGVGGRLVDSARSRFVRPSGVRRRSGGEGRTRVRDDPMAGAWIVEIAIAALVLLLVAEVAGVPLTGYLVVISLIIGWVIVTVLHIPRK